MIISLRKNKMFKNNIRFLIKKYDAKINKEKVSFCYNSNKIKNFESNLFKDLAKKKIDFDNIEIKRSNLEEIFIRLVND